MEGGIRCRFKSIRSNRSFFVSEFSIESHCDCGERNSANDRLPRCKNHTTDVTSGYRLPISYFQLPVTNSLFGLQNTFLQLKTHKCQENRLTAMLLSVILALEADDTRCRTKNNTCRCCLQMAMSATRKAGLGSYNSKENNLKELFLS